MPVTYNGIGTRYHGRSNVQTRPGTCRSCRRGVQLSSYDTRLWFVFLFIPVIPLGRKRIVDFCPSCRRHYAIDLHKWETARQLEVSGAQENFRTNPTVESAIAAHRQMLEFHQTAEAAEFQKTMVAQFPDSAKICAYLGAAYEHLGRPAEAAEFYARALALRPDLPEARVGVARGHIRGGRLGDARKLLDFLEKPGAAQLYPLEPLETLARAYQSAGSHQEALDLFGKIIEALPKIAEHPGFRKAVKKSESALARGGTILPKQSFSLKRLFQSTRAGGGRPLAGARGLLLLAVILALVILGFVVSNVYISHHRTLYLVNGFAVPAPVRVSGVGTVKNFKGVRTLTLAEGHYHAVIDGPAHEEISFDVHDDYFNRWYGHPLWLINVAGGALLQQSDATYSEHPQPPAVSFHVGHTFEHFPTVTHPFSDLPKSVQVNSGQSRTLVQLQVFPGDAADVFGYYDSKGSSEAPNLAETWLRVHPDDSMMLRVYTATAERRNYTDRLGAFVRTGLTNRPVLTEWHRVYQNLHDRPAERAALLGEYDALLQADPANSALLYLRGRIESNRAATRDYFKKAIDADPRNSYAVYALAYEHVANADWAGARPLLARAIELSPHDPNFGNSLFVTRLALGEAPALEQELRSRLSVAPLDLPAEAELFDTLAAQNKPGDVIKACEALASMCRSRYGSAAQMVVNGVQYHAYYAVGDFAKLKDAAVNDPTPAGRISLEEALIEQGEIDDAARNLPMVTNLDGTGLFPMALAVASRMGGDEAGAARWKSRAIEVLQRGSIEMTQTADLIKRGTAPTRADVENLSLPPEFKALVLARLSLEYPQVRLELAGFARELNAGREFPYHLVRRATAATP